MARIRSGLSRGLNLVRLAWMAVLTLVIAETSAIDGPTAAVGAAVVIVVLLAVSGQNSLSSQLRSLTEPAHGPPVEEQRLRGAFRRQSAPDTPGRPRLPRAPGQAPVAA